MPRGAISARRALPLLSTGEIDWAELVARQRSSHRSMGLRKEHFAVSQAPRASKGTTPPASSRHQPKVVAAPPAAELSREETVALAVRTDPSLKGAEDIGLHMLDDPDLGGVGGDGLVKLMRRTDQKAYRASMALEQQAKRRAEIGAIWERAVVAVCGGLRAAPQATDRNAGSISEIWGRAITAVFPPAPATSQARLER